MHDILWCLAVTKIASTEIFMIIMRPTFESATNSMMVYLENETANMVPVNKMDMNQESITHYFPCDSTKCGRRHGDRHQIIIEIDLCYTSH